MLREISLAGRLGRSGFWLRHVTLVPLGLWAVIAAGHSPGAPYDLPLAAALLLLLVSIWGRRLHDRGRSAWWLLVLLLPVLGALFLIVECGLRKAGTNAGRFGPAPGARADYLTVQQAHHADSSP